MHQMVDEGFDPKIQVKSKFPDNLHRILRYNHKKKIKTFNRIEITEKSIAKIYYIMYVCVICMYLNISTYHIFYMNINITLVLH